MRTAGKDGSDGNNPYERRERDRQRGRGRAARHEMHHLAGKAPAMRMRRVIVIAVIVVMMAGAVLERAPIIVVGIREDDQRRNVRHGGGMQCCREQHLQPDRHEAEPACEPVAGRLNRTAFGMPRNAFHAVLIASVAALSMRQDSKTYAVLRILYRSFPRRRNPN